MEDVDGGLPGRGAPVESTPPPGTGMTQGELDARTEADAALFARPREMMSDAERAYLEAREWILAGKKPRHVDNIAKWMRETLTANPTSVSKEAGFARGPIAGDNKRYGYIFRLLASDGKVPVRRVDEPEELGQRGFAQSLLQLRSAQLDLVRRLELAEGKAVKWDGLVDKLVMRGRGRRGSKAGRG